MVETVKPTTRRGVRAPSAPVYTLGTNPAERERLQRQSHDLAAHSLALLSHVDLPAGWPGARPRLRPGGDDRAARRACRANGLGRPPSTSTRPTSPWPGGWCRTVAWPTSRCSRPMPATPDCRQARSTSCTPGCCWSTSRSPEQVVAEMVRLVKPGGWVITDEVDGMAGICYPPDPAWDRLREILHAAYLRRRGRPLHRPQADPPARRRRAGRHRGRRARRRVPGGPRPPHPPPRPRPQHVGQGRRRAGSPRRTSSLSSTAGSASAWLTRPR